MRPATLTIALDAPAVHLFGERTTSAGQVLTGTVKLSLRTATKIRALHLTFFGEQIISYVPRLPQTPGQKLSAAGTVLRNKCLADLTQNLIEPDSQKQMEYVAGTYNLRFAFALPGDLPPTAKLLFGHILYTVKAQLVLTGLRSGCTAEEPVVVLRCPGEGSQWAHTVFDALSVRAQWDNRISVEAESESCAVAADSMLELKIQIDPTEKGFSLLALDTVLKETQSVRDGEHGSSEGGSTTVHRESRAVARKRLAYGAGGAPLGGQDEHMLQLQIPPATTGVQYECESVDVKISHHLAITALIKSPQGQTVEVMLPAHIYVLPQACIDGSADLPLYELSGSDRLVQSAESSSASAEASPRSSTHSSRTIIESLVGDTPSRSLPPYSLPVCLSCGKEDISVLQCRQAIVSRSQIPLNAEIEDLCVSR